MKKKLTSLLILLILAATLAFSPACKKDLKKEYAKDIAKEMELSFNFFWEQAQTDEQYPATYGLIVDRWPAGKDYSSIASVGFGLTAYVIGVEQGYVTHEEAGTRSEKTLDTLLALQQRGGGVAWEGFFAHFINNKTGARHGKCEISSVDTAILLCGALTAGEYFGGAVKEKAQTLYSNVNWKSFIKTRGSKSYISMAYNPDTDTVSSGCWDWYAEQLMIYVLGAGSPNAEHRLDDKTYYDFTRQSGSYGSSGEFIYSYFGSIFTYQYSHAWINFKGLKDKNGTDWFENSVRASKAAYEYCADRKSQSETFKKGGWGLTACDAPNGYNGHLGASPRGWTPDAAYYDNEGTVAPAGAIGSVVFTPEESLKALRYYQSLEFLNGTYGLRDSYNLDKNYAASDCIGIDKGISLVMLQNYLDGSVWETFMKNACVKSGLDVLGFTKA